MKTLKSYNKIDILFFERPLADLRRFAFKISKKLKEKNKNIKLAAICIELPKQEECLSIDYYYHRNEVKNIDDFLIKSQIKLIVFSNHRIPDMEIILHAKKLGIKTVLLQEGVIFRGQNINEISFENIIASFKFIPKVLSYYHVLQRMCRYDRTPLHKIIYNLLKEKEIVNTISQSYSVPLNCDYVFTMGESWSEYYIREAGYREDQIRLIGNHDLDSFIPKGIHEKAICYIATILVEDGTVKKSDFDLFLTAMANAIDPKVKIYIKLHPRSNEKLYAPLYDHNIEFVRKGDLPSVNVYIGHSSTLIGRALYESDQLILYRFPHEKENYYERFATAVCHNEKELRDAIKQIEMSQTSNKKLQLINKVYWKNPNGAITTASNNIYEYLLSNKIL